MFAPVALLPLAVLLGAGLWAAAYGRDWLGSILLVALPTTAAGLAITFITLEIEDWEEYSDCVEGCEKPESLQRAFDAAEVIAYVFAFLLIVAVGRWVVLAARARRARS